MDGERRARSSLRREGGRVTSMVVGRGVESDSLARELPGWMTAAVVIGAFGALLWFERRRPLRRRVDPAPEREGRNLAMAALSAVAIRLTEKPLTSRLTRIVHRRRIGFVKMQRLPAALEVTLSVVLLD